MGNKIDEMRQVIMKINKKMPRDQLEQHIVEFIKSHDMCVLATTSKDNIPRATPIWYNSEGTTIYMVGDEGTKLNNIRANPRVSIGIHDIRTSFQSVKGIQITGQATLITADNPECEEALRIYQFQERTKRVRKEMAELLGMEPPEEIGKFKPPKDMTMIKIEARKIALIETALLAGGYTAGQVWEAQES